MTNTEKLTLLMLCDLYEHLDIKGDIDHNIVRNAISSGNLWAIDQEYHLSDDEDIPKKVHDEVNKTLFAYRCLSSSLRNLAPDDQIELQTKYDLKLENNFIQFPGYDGNNESEHHSVTQMLGTLGSYEEQSEIDKNSHQENNQDYRNLIFKMENLCYNGANRSKLNKQQLEELLALCPTYFD